MLTAIGCTWKICCEGSQEARSLYLVLAVWSIAGVGEAGDGGRGAAAGGVGLQDQPMILALSSSVHSEPQPAGPMSVSDMDRLRVLGHTRRGIHIRGTAVESDEITIS